MDTQTTAHHERFTRLQVEADVAREFAQVVWEMDVAMRPEANPIAFDASEDSLRLAVRALVKACRLAGHLAENETLNALEPWTATARNANIR